MGKILPNKPVKLIIGLIFKDEEILSKVLTILCRYFGKTDFASPSIPFNSTDYYTAELGTSLFRKFVSFNKLIPTDSLVKIKILTNKIENKFSTQSKRKINIDPGYINLAKLVLASTKDFAHRIYLGHGIYAEITLSYKKKSFEPNDLTYPDYRLPNYIQMFNQIRDIYACQIKEI